MPLIDSDTDSCMERGVVIAYNADATNAARKGVVEFLTKRSPVNVGTIEVQEGEPLSQGGRAVMYT